MNSIPLLRNRSPKILRITSNPRIATIAGAPTTGAEATSIATGVKEVEPVVVVPEGLAGMIAIRIAAVEEVVDGVLMAGTNGMDGGTSGHANNCRKGLRPGFSPVQNR